MLAMKYYPVSNKHLFTAVGVIIVILLAIGLIWGGDGG
jgi:cytochrome b